MQPSKTGPAPVLRPTLQCLEAISGQPPALEKSSQCGVWNNIVRFCREGENSALERELVADLRGMQATGWDSSTDTHPVAPCRWIYFSRHSPQGFFLPCPGLFKRTSQEFMAPRWMGPAPPHLATSPVPPATKAKAFLPTHIGGRVDG